MKIKKSKLGDFSSVENWIEKIYQDNKGILEPKLTLRPQVGVNKATPEQLFKSLMKEQMSEGKSPTKALKALLNSRIFTPYQELAAENLKKTMQKFDVYKTFREYTKDAKGRYQKFDSTLLKYDAEIGGYIYNNLVSIILKNSPQSVDVNRL